MRRMAAFLSVSGLCYSNGFCIRPNEGIPLNFFATSFELTALTQQVTALSAQMQSMNATLNARIDAAFASINGLSAQFSTLNTQFGALSNQVAGFEAQIADVTEQMSDAFDLVAVAAALKDAIPNPGDRFAMRVNAAGFSGHFAGAVGLSVNLAERARLSVNYGRGQSQGIVSGGVNLSFR